MLEITSKDWYINLSSIPDEESEEYAAFWEYQQNLCINGCVIDGVTIPGELYWHLNFWKTRVDYEVEIGGVKVVRDKLINPVLRDNEWIVFNEIKRAHAERKGLMIFGSRRISKTTSLSSYLCHGATFDEGSQNVLAGTNSNDIRVMVNMMDVGLNNLPDYFTWQRLKDDWKTQVTLGAKTKQNKNIPFSHLIIRNLAGGNNEEAIAGTKPRRLVIDEALAEDEVVYKNHQPIPIKDIQIGDYITGGDGNLTKVLDKIDVGVKELFEVTLSDGRKVRCCDDHLWKAYSSQSGWEILRTKDIRSSQETYYLTEPFTEIVSITPSGKGQAYCIKVDNSDKLFLTTHGIVTHNCGKEDWLDAYLAAAPGFTTPYGLACSPIISGTSGDMEKFMDAKKVFFNCEAYNFLAYDDIKNNSRKHGLFLGAKFRQEAKEPTTLGNYLSLPEESDLHNLQMLVSNEEKAFEITDSAIEKLRKAGEKKKYLKEKMYFPKEVDDIFLNTNVNMYNVDAARAQQLRIKTENLGGIAVELFNDGEGIKHKVSSKEFITEYPLQSQSADAPIMIWEFPIPNPPKFLYVAGVDSYRFDNAKYTDSLGCVYIYKRMHSIAGDAYQDMIVACYCARPETQDIWNENVRKLLKYYNAYALVENDELGFINYMKSLNEAEMYLAPQPKFQSSLLSGATSLNRPFGVSRQSEKVRNFLNGLYKKYLDEVIEVKKDEEGNVTGELTGVRRIFDYALLEETANYFDGANVDRIVAFQCALALAEELDPLLGPAAQESSQSRYQVMMSKNRGSNKLFKPVGRSFTKRKR